MRSDIARPDMLAAAAASFLDTWRSNIIFTTRCNFNQAVLAAAHSTTTAPTFPPCLTSRLPPAHPFPFPPRQCKSTHSPVYAFNFDVSDLCQRLHVPRPSMSALPCRSRTRPFLTRAENAPSLPHRCSPLSRTAHAPTARCQVASPGLSSLLQRLTATTTMTDASEMTAVNKIHYRACA